MNNIEKTKDFFNKLQGLIDNAIVYQGQPSIRVEDLENTFPELKESEDERIRKALIKFHKSTIDIDGIKGKQIIAWLEKQKDYVSPQMVADSYLRGYNDAEKKSLEKQGSKPQGKSALEAINEQNPNNKSKFNVDDWICNSACIVHIASIKDGMYYFDEGDGLDITFVNNNYHLWSIADAKNGDVLSNGKIIVIFKHFEDPSYRQHIVAYIGLDRSGDIQITDDTWRLGIDKAKPATKEQRDTLIKAMTDAGYTFDFDKKELKKIESSLPSFDEQQGTPVVDIPFGAKDSELQEASYHIPEGFYAEIQCDKVVIKKGKNPSWSEGDSFMTRTLIDVVKSRASIRPELRNEFAKWLESLKQRVKGE